MLKARCALFFLVFSTGLVFASNLGSFPPRPGVETKPVISVKPALKKVTKVKTLALIAFAYSPPAFPKGQLTFSGFPVGWGIVAVDPKVIPLGSIVYFPGYFQGKRFLALDIGEYIKGNRIDIWLPNKKSALNWGRRLLLAEVEGRS